MELSDNTFLLKVIELWSWVELQSPFYWTPLCSLFFPPPSLFVLPTDWHFYLPSSSVESLLSYVDHSLNHPSPVKPFLLQEPFVSPVAFTGLSLLCSPPMGVHSWSRTVLKQRGPWTPYTRSFCQSSRQDLELLGISCSGASLRNVLN